MSFSQMKQQLQKLQYQLRQFFFPNKQHLSQEQKTELNEIYYNLQMAEQHLDKFLEITAKTDHL